MRLVPLLLVVVRSSVQDVCDPTLCVLPKCRCYQDQDIPGKLQVFFFFGFFLFELEESLHSTLSCSKVNG